MIHIVIGFIVAVMTFFSSSRHLLTTSAPSGLWIAISVVLFVIPAWAISTLISFLITKVPAKPEVQNGIRALFLVLVAAGFLIAEQYR